MNRPSFIKFSSSKVRKRSSRVKRERVSFIMVGLFKRTILCDLCLPKPTSPRLRCLSFRTLKMDERALRMGERRRLLEEEMYLEEEDEELWFCCGLHRVEGPSYYDITTVFLWIFSAFCLYLIFRAIFATQESEPM